MGRGILGLVLAVALAGGCAQTPPPGGSGEARGPLWSIELYLSRPAKPPYFNTFPRQRLFVSDREVWVACRWNPLSLGEHVSKVAFQPPGGVSRTESQYRFRAEDPSWITFQRFKLPTASEGKALAGEWRVEVSLDDSPAGTRAFQFVAASIRVRTDVILFVTDGMGDPEGPGGGYRWTQEAQILQQTKAAAGLAGQVMREELSRRFPHVAGPPATEVPSADSFVIHPILRFPPNLSTPARLELEISRPGVREKRKFTFNSTVGTERVGALGTTHFNLAASDLAFQAASDPTVLEYLIQASKASPEE